MSATLTYTPGPLSESQIETFDREGYLVVDDIFTDGELQPVIDEISQVVDDRARELLAAGKLSQLYDELDFSRRMVAMYRECPEAVSGIWNGTLALPSFFHLMRTPRLLDVAQQMIGPEIIASSVYRLRPKIPYHPQGPVPWHQDSGYFEPYCDDALVLTVWLPLVDATQENGCLWVMPRAHKGQVVEHARHASAGYLVIPDDELPRPTEPVCCPVKKGGALLLSNRTPHASFENTTDHIRWSMDLRYQSAKLPTNYAMPRGEGDSTPDASKGIPTACYPPEADFLIRSHTRPESVVDNPQRFEQIRKLHKSGSMTRRWTRVWQEGD